MKKISFIDHKRMYKQLFDSDEGRKVLHDLGDKFYLTKPTLRKGESESDFLVREGMRQVVLYILTQVNYDIDEYIENMKYHKTEVIHE